MTTPLSTGELPQSEDTRLIPLTQGQFSIVDAADYEWLSQWKWRVLISKAANTKYALRTEGGRTILMHRLIMGVDSQVPCVDHVDRNGLHNWRSNLRPATKSQNGQNRRINKNNKSGIKGVCQRRDGKWQAVVALDGKDYWAGRHNTQEEATVARDSLAKNCTESSQCLILVSRQPCQLLGRRPNQ